MAASKSKYKKKIAAVAAIYLLLARRRRLRIRWERRRWWCRDWILRREKCGVYTTLLRELEAEDQGGYRAYMRMTPANFYELLRLIGPQIQKMDTRCRLSISPEQRLAITLRFLATGESFHSLHFSYRVGRSTVSSIVKETARVIYNTLKENDLKMPDKKEEWMEVAKGFQEKWNYPFCLGALDGKHVKIKSPECSGSMYFNYKHYFSIVLLALVDANYKFLYVDVGSAGRNGDAGIFADSSLKGAMDRGLLNFPEPDVLPGTEDTCSYHIVGDDAFGLSKNLMKPYSHRNVEKDVRIYNYRCSRARRCVENAFGILCSRFRLFLTQIELEPNFVEDLILASCCLHNFLICKQASQYIYNLVDENGKMRVNPGLALDRQQLGRYRNAPVGAKAQREALKRYFLGTGAVSWQDKMSGGPN